MRPSCKDLASDRRSSDKVSSPSLVTVGHGTLHRDELVQLLGAKSVQLVIDVRSAPGSRHHPQFDRAEMERWLPAVGIGYRWEPDLGGFRRPLARSVNTALRHPSFRGYADDMATDRFRAGLGRLLEDATQRCTAVVCAESLWWRCHRRLIADAAALMTGAAAWHLGHDCRVSPHRLTEGVRAVEESETTWIVYDAGSAERHGVA
jgi:uncharacterized protein (DUF488 family)